ncbi:porin [Pedobacter sp. BAL39]|uniref:porin n=1 Tax=Pedobacter sp. BAL39 TaxID=391596 RepID=UPI0012FCE460|nr:porin [Pedobacter sp. BAL39]
MKRAIIALTCALHCLTNLHAQEFSKIDSTKLKIYIQGLLQARYSYSSNAHVDLNGQHHLDNKAIYNDFDLKRVRLQFTSKISDRTEVFLLLNLAEFKSDPKNKVLENAFLTYRLNTHLNFKMGQFRPAFGLEDMYPVDLIKSLEYSNQYTAFGNNGWQSFQMGASIYGAIAGTLPLRYELTVVNGNNRNQVMDNDNGKHFSSRVEMELNKKHLVKLGLNGGLANVSRTGAYATGADLSGTVPICKKWSLEIETEFKQGSNHVLYYNLDSAARQGSLSNYQMRGAYFLPNLRYAINYHRLRSIELSCRYEYFDADFKHLRNPRQTYTPMISTEFLKTYNARIQLGINIDRYKHNESGTTRYNNETIIVQVQTRL